ncbi:MAG: N-acetylmuramoyl-L-alanine amidase [Eubacterium sp.]|nr:N-acetylmuramoyl-L-alanine amidase [Eubacterium sp.]
MRFKRLRERFLAMLLCSAMVITMFPANVTFAAENSQATYASQGDAEYDDKSYDDSETPDSSTPDSDVTDGGDNQGDKTDDISGNQDSETDDITDAKNQNGTDDKTATASDELTDDKTGDETDSKNDDKSSDKKNEKSNEKSEDKSEQAEDNIAQDSPLAVNFAVVEEPLFTTPSGDKFIVVDFGDGATTLSDVQLVLLNETTNQEYRFAASDNADSSYLFYVNFPDESYSGVYSIKSVEYTENNVLYEKLMKDGEIAPKFGVNTQVTTEPDLYLEETEEVSVTDDQFTSEDGVYDISDNFSNADVIGIEGDDDSKIDISDLTSAIENGVESAKTIDLGNGLSMSINTEELLSAAIQNTAGKGSNAPGNIVIVLDPGHGSYDAGATRTWDGVTYKERDLNQEIANACKAELDKYDNVTVYMTRTSVNDVLHEEEGDDLYWRCKFAYEKGADLFVSIHCNSSEGSIAHGAEVYVPNSSYNLKVYNVGKTVGESIGKQLEKLGIYYKGYTQIRNSENGTLYSDGSIADYYAVIRACKQYGIPGMIVEHAYVSNYNDCIKFLSTKEKLQALGKADAAGIAENIGLIQQNRSGKNPKNDGWQQVGNNWLYYDKNGKLQTGFFQVDGNTYYGKSNGYIVTGWQLIGGEWYCFNNKGIMYINDWAQNKRGGKSYLGADGKMAVGITKTKKGYYFFDNDGNMLTGWKKYNKNWYYMDYAGRMYRSKWLYEKNRYYYLRCNGTMAKGFINKDGNRYYLNNNGILQTGWIKVDGVDYYADSKGVIYISKWHTDSSGRTYFLNKKGKMVTGWVYIKKKKYYFNKSGVMQKGWLKGKKGWYYLRSDGTAVINDWQKFTDGTTYYLDKSGKMLTGIQTIGGKKYFFNKSGQLRTGWIKSGKYWYYSNSDGTLRYNQWLKYNKKRYYFNENGRMVTKAIILNKKRFFFNSNGELTGSESLNPKKPDNGNTNKDDPNKDDPNKDDPNNKNDVSKLHLIMGKSDVTAKQLAENYESSGFTYPAKTLKKGGAKNITTFCTIIIEEAKAEGVMPEVVYAQVMHETGWLQFGGDVKISQYNFCGLGATGGGNPGCTFADVRTGIRAQVQHLKAYASSKALKQTCVDPRFQYVERNVARYVEYLGQKENPKGKGWATAPQYGYKLLNIIYSID